MTATHPDATALAAALPPELTTVVVRDGARTIVATEPVVVEAAADSGAFDALARIDQDGGWWAGFLSYDLGRAVERVEPRATDDLGLPDMLLGRFDARVMLEPGRAPLLVGSGPGHGLLAHALERCDRVAGPPPPTLHSWRSNLAPDEWADRVRAVLDLLLAGECYQVNLTRRLTSDEPCDPLALFAALQRGHPAPHAALLRFGAGAPVEVAVVSASPERFLRREVAVVETRPIKGTATDPVRLVASVKDRAENLMIVDLARNDLGRVCAYGSVKVPGLFEVEAHPGLHHLVSTVRGTLRDGVGTDELVRATFPPASVTGAPKPRVLQAIEDLEPVRRGVYCGAIGWIDADERRADLSVAIRTFTVRHGRTHLGVGGGIVADSRPAAEWEETELKAARLLATADGDSTATTQHAVAPVAQVGVFSGGPAR